MYEKVSAGIFFEAGGTSVDISVIKNGKVIIKYAQVGEHKTYLQSLDVRTLGIAGGSMIRVQNGKIVDVGPRSAHIAGVEYECFQDTGRLNDLRVELVSPREDDPAEYAVVKLPMEPAIPSLWREPQTFWAMCRRGIMPEEIQKVQGLPGRRWGNCCR